MYGGEKKMHAYLLQDVSIGHNLKRLRQEAGYTQEELSEKLQVAGYPVSNTIVSRMERGRYSIRIGILIELKKLYDVSYDEFFRDL